ncbi:MAG: hypothetical protein HOP10_10590 [Chitinophagaceae bacterium]|nr:hypothetical protein [Chitinophagaceae bacterium]
MKLTALLYMLIIVLFLPTSCSKTGGILPPPPPDPCSLISVNLNGVVVNPSVSGASDGSITLSASGGSGFTFNINGGAFQSYHKFNNLPAGNYTVMARNSDGCSSVVAFLLSNPTPSCTGVNITVSATATNNVFCESSTATITVSASGGTAPYTYNLNGGAYQAANVFTNIATGSYMITAKDANGCIGNASTTVNNGTAGPLFTQVRTLVRNNCLYCHGGVFSSGGVSYSDDCNIVSGKLRIQARAVDGNPSPMPQSGLLPAADRQKIIDWINAGGRYSD